MDRNLYYVHMIRDIYNIIDKDLPILIRRPRKFIFVSKITPPAEVKEKGKLRKITIKIEKSIAESSVRRYTTYFLLIILTIDRIRRLKLPKSHRLPVINVPIPRSLQTRKRIRKRARNYNQRIFLPL